MSSEPVSPRKKRLGFWVRVVVTGATFLLLVRLVSFEDLASAVRRIHLGAMVSCFLAVLVGQLAGVVRFQLLFDAYGADRKLSWAESTRLFFVAAFYNTYLPGALAGDVLRAVAIRSCFRERGLTGALAISFVERVTGLAGMLLLIAAVSLLRPIPQIRGLLALSVLGLLGAALAIGALVVGRRAARFLPGPLRELARGVPELRAPSAFVGVLASAVVTHVLTALGFHAIMQTLSDRASLAESLVIVPVACSAAYIPATIAGAGTRDAAFVFLYQQVGVAPADSLAMSIAALVCSLLVAAIGGVANLLGPYEKLEE